MERIIDLRKLRQTLKVLEETIIFALIQRTMYRVNPSIYLKKGMVSDYSGSFLDFILLGTEKIHAKAGRFENPDEFPFFGELPDPIFKRSTQRSIPDVKAQKKQMNMNSKIKKVYLEEIIPRICMDGLDFEFRSSAVLDVNALSAISKRIHFGIFIAESKFLSDQTEYSKAVKKRDTLVLMEMLTNKKAEEEIYQRVVNKASFYGCNDKSGPFIHIVNPEIIADIYRDWIIPLTKNVEIQYLLARLD